MNKDKLNEEIKRLRDELRDCQKEIACGFSSMESYMTTINDLTAKIETLEIIYNCLD